MASQTRPSSGVCGHVCAWSAAGTHPPRGWADDLRKLLPFTHLQGKGLWATEGVVTFPFRGRYVLAVNSHFYEFRDLESGEVLPSWELGSNPARRGRVYQPLLTTGSGFFRYELQDRIRLEGFMGECPTFAFEGRMGGTDLVGEKMDRALASGILEDLTARGRARCITLLAALPDGSKPGYVVLAEKGQASDLELASELETLLKGSHHYRLARELGQLAPASAKTFDTAQQAMAFYEQARRSTSGEAKISGGAKVEPLLLWKP
jgi:hypothetical protein